VFLGWYTLSSALPLIESHILGILVKLYTVCIILLGLVLTLTWVRFFVNILTSLVVAWLLYILFVNFLFVDSSQYGYLDTFIDTTLWVSVFLTFYYVFYNDDEGMYLQKMLAAYPYFYALVFVIVTYRIYFNIDYSLIQVHQSDEINSVYWILALTPLSFLMKNKAVRYVIIISAFFLILLSTKRLGAIAISIIFISSIAMDGKSSGYRFWKLLIGLIILCVSLFVFYFIAINDEINVIQRLSTTDLSEESRMELYLDTMDKYSLKEPVYQLIGSGHRSTGRDRGLDLVTKTSHNDFIEVLYNYGLIGLIIYLFIFFRLLSRLKKVKMLGLNAYAAYASCLVLFLTMSMVSHLVIYPSYFAFLVLLFALFESRIIKNGL
jgi:hypothetical protein